MALDEILAAMEASAQAEEARLREEARRQAEQIVRAAQDEVGAARERLFREAAARLQAATARLDAEARLRTAARRAQARDALVAEAFGRAAEALMNARRAESYPNTLRALLSEALAQFPPGTPLRVLCDARDLPLLTRLIAATDANLTLEGSLSSWGGVVVQDPRGEVVADNTLEQRLARARERLWPQVARLVLSPSLPPSADTPPGTTGATASEDRDAAPKNSS